MISYLVLDDVLSEFANYWSSQCNVVLFAFYDWYSISWVYNCYNLEADDLRNNCVIYTTWNCGLMHKLIRMLSNIGLIHFQCSRVQYTQT